MKQTNEIESPNPCNKSSFATKKVGLGLVILSFILYGGILLVPAMPFSFGVKALVTSALVFLGEVSFWVGGFILGKDVIKKYKKLLNPLSWFKKTS